MPEANDLPEIIRRKRHAWTADDLAALLGVSAKYLYKQVRAGRLPAYKLGSMLRFNPMTTAAWLQSRQTTGR